MTASYKRVLPSLSKDYLGMSIMKSDTHFYAISEGFQVNTATTATGTWKAFATHQSIILSTDSTEICYSLYPDTYTSFTLSNSVAVNALTAYNYFS